jgi:DNA-binding MarR family transcriptional regulator
MTAHRSDVALRLHAAAIHLLRTVRSQDRQLGLTPARLSVLSILVFGGPHTLTQLTDVEQVAAPTMTKLIAGLEREGYVIRRPARFDGRSWVIHATAKARRVLHMGRQRRIDALMNLLAGATRAEWETVERALDVIDRALAS